MKCLLNCLFVVIVCFKFILECGLSMWSDVDCIVLGIVLIVNEVVVKFVIVK